MADIYDFETYEPRKGVGHLLHRVRSAMLASIDREMAENQELAAMEVTSAQFLVLSTLSHSDVRSASDLCKGMSYDAGAMTRMIDRLEEKGLLRRSRCPSDRRLVNLELTEKGSQAMPLMRLAAMKVVNRYLTGFSRTEARQLEGFLTRMLDNALRAG